MTVPNDSNLTSWFSLANKGLVIGYEIAASAGAEIQRNDDQRWPATSRFRISARGYQSGDGHNDLATRPDNMRIAGRRQAVSRPQDRSPGAGRVVPR